MRKIVLALCFILITRIGVCSEINKISTIIEPDKATLSKWNNEAMASLSKINAPNFEVNIYALHGAPQHEDGGIEYGITLLEKPKSHIIEIPLDSNGLNFYYQDTLENDYINNVDVLPNQTLEEYLTTHNRPENVVGSYAVYGNNKNGKYKTGKVFHIYRPQAVDSSGETTWCELDYSNNSLNIIVPQNFLDIAVYPVEFIYPEALTLGYTTLGASTALTAGSALNGAFDTNFPQNGTLSKIYIGVRSNTGTQVCFKAGVYDDTSTDPNDLISSESLPICTTSTTKAFYPASGEAITGTLNNATKYWVVWISDSTNGLFAYDTGGVSGENFFDVTTYNYASGLPANITNHTDSSAKRSMYVEYTASGATPTVESIMRFEGTIQTQGTIKLFL